ncbi:hypothetical protein ZBT109_1309 [Zymobacter palmae]|uniref:Uncharacterized protein n=1 Tax=Zymobacter palmae TaxID=33074 RepID=A0A348HEL7_9GAMM|nr:hypothetical protein ZBT109_1309 [Zymobacter palmae]
MPGTKATSELINWLTTLWTSWHEQVADALMRFSNVGV